MQILDAKSEALIQAGLVKPIDAMLFLAFLCDGLVTFFAWLFSPSFKTGYLVCSLSIALFIFLFWILLVGYRTCVLVLEARADINMMPENAARLARLYQPTAVSTGDKPQKK